jgi:hypothetical protein
MTELISKKLYIFKICNLIPWKLLHEADYFFTVTSHSASQELQ